MLVNALFDYSGLTVLVNPNPRTLVKHINILAESDARSALTEWVKLGITNVEYLRQRVTEYLTGVMNAVEDRFSAYTRTFMVKLALIVTLVLGIDTFQVAGELWRNSDLRAVSSAVSILATDQGGQAAASAADSIDLGGLSIKIGWLANDHPVKASVVVWTIYIIVKILGLGITTACVAQGSAFWFGLLKKLD